MKMIGQHGSEIGVIKDMCVDVEAWQLLSLEVELKREASDALKLKRPWFGSQTVHLPASEISGATDILIIKSPLEKLNFSSDESA